MAENANSGCGFLGVVGIVSLTLVAVFTSVKFSDPYALSPTHTVHASPSPSSFSIVATLVPQKSNTYFTVENNEISYGYFHTLGQPCYYVLSGHVLDHNKKPFTDFIVNIKTVEVEGVVPESGYAIPGNGSFDEDGIAGWIALLPILTDYEIWLTTKLNGTELSPHILIHMRDCDQNRAIVNFIQTPFYP